MRCNGSSKVLVISPHLDDAVFGAGRLIAAHRGTVVVTVFAGVPAAGMTTAWDRQCGFDDARTAMLARREEDRRALRTLSAHPCWLDFLDAQYGSHSDASAIAEALRGVIDSTGAETVLAPCGLYHSDHLLVHEACLDLRPRLSHCQWLLYEDALYRRKQGLLQQRLAVLAMRGLSATPVFPGEGAASLKEGAVQSYASQLRAFGDHGYADVGAPERFWQLDAVS